MRRARWVALQPQRDTTSRERPGERDNGQGHPQDGTTRRGMFHSAVAMCTRVGMLDALASDAGARYARYQGPPSFQACMVTAVAGERRFQVV